MIYNSYIFINKFKLYILISIIHLNKYYIIFCGTRDMKASNQTTILREKIKIIGSKYNVTESEELELIYRAISENKDDLVEDILVPKKWKQFKKQLSELKGLPQMNQTIKTPSKSPILYFRHQLPTIKKKTSDKAIKTIIMGPCGNGKTCLVNHLCGSNLPAGDTPSSLTRNITELKSQFQYPIPFVLYDTPGTTAHVDKMEHATHLKCLLQYKPVNTVCILVKFDGRYDELINNIYRQVLMLAAYKKSIVFLVSHFDMAKNPKEAIQSVDLSMKELELDNQVVYFSNQFINEKHFSDCLYSICHNMEAVSIKIDMKVFYKYFNLKKQETQQKYFQTFQKKLIEQMQAISEAYQKFAVSLPNDEERDAIFQDTEITLKNQLNQLLDLFVQKYKNSMAITDYYTSYFTLQLKINDYLDSFQNKIKSLHRYNLIQSSATGSKLDIRDLIKKCPNSECGLVWFRIQACPNTSCGRRPSCSFDFMKKVIFRYKIVRDKKSNKITMEKNNLTKLTNDPKGNGINRQLVQVRVKKGSVGCGQSMDFQTLPRLPNIEKILIQWYNVNTIQEVVKRFQEDEEIEKTRKKFEEQANLQFGDFIF